jgi:hypothetical protein
MRVVKSSRTKDCPSTIQTRKHSKSIIKTHSDPQHLPVMTSIRRNIVRKQLAWMPKVWLATLKAHRRAASHEIVGFELTFSDSLELPAEFLSLTGMEYFYVSRGPANTDGGIHIHQPGLDPRLVKADLLAYSCTNAIYTF